MITQEELKLALHYDECTGAFTWRHRADMTKLWNGRYAGKRAGCDNGAGYIFIHLHGRRHYAHRLAWLYVYGVVPQTGIDHADLNPANNRISNLRLANQTQNGWNKRKQRNNTSGFKGVTLDRRSGKWHAQISVNKKHIHIGSFDDKEAAAKAHAAAVAKYHGEFARAS